MTTVAPRTTLSALPLSAQVLARGLASHARALVRGGADERRVVVGCLLTLGATGGYVGLNRLGRGIDRLRGASYRTQRPRAPVFVVAPARSGTTLLYNLLAADSQFVGPKLYQVMFASETLLDAFEAIARRMSESQREAALARIHQDLLKTDAIHRTRIHELEEDGPYFELRMASPFALRHFPFDPELVAHTRLDDLAPAKRRSVMESYYRMVQLVLDRAEHGQTYLAKAVCSAGRIGALLEHFPDARMIHIVRHPYSVFASAMHMHWHMSYVGIDPKRRPPIKDSVFTRSQFENLVYTFRTLLAWERRLPPEGWLTLRFEQLVADPLATIERVYAHFGIERSPAAREAQELACAQSKRHRARVRPPELEAFGLSRAQIHEALGEVFEAYELEP